MNRNGMDKNQENAGKCRDSSEYQEGKALDTVARIACLQVDGKTMEQFAWVTVTILE